MSNNKSAPPSVPEMGVRILNNLTRVKSYLATLKMEIDTPGRLGPGSSREDWIQATNALEKSLNELDKYLRAKDPGAEYE